MLLGSSHVASSVCRGFQLLAKMGYKAGEGIGKDGRGRAAPLSVDLKAGRTGLGVDEEKKRKQHSYKQLQELRSVLRVHCLPCMHLSRCALLAQWWPLWIPFPTSAARDFCAGYRASYCDRLIANTGVAICYSLRKQFVSN